MTTQDKIKAVEKLKKLLLEAKYLIYFNQLNCKCSICERKRKLIKEIDKEVSQ